MLKNRLVMAMVTGVLIALAVSETSAQVESLTVRVDGLACPFCAYGIEKKLKRVEGVHAVTVDMQGGTVSLAAKPGQSIDFRRVPSAIDDSGFTARDIRISVSGFIEKTGDRLQLNWDGRSLPMSGLQGNIRKELLSLTERGGTVQVSGAIGEEDGVWTITPEEVEGIAP